MLGNARRTLFSRDTRNGRRAGWVVERRVDVQRRFYHYRGRAHGRKFWLISTLAT